MNLLQEKPLFAACCLTVFDTNIVVDSTDREGVEEFKGSGLGDWDKACASGGDRDGNGATNKRKLSIDATSAPSSVVPSAPACLSSAGVVSTGLGSVTKSRYTTLPPSFAESSTGSTGSTGSGVKMSAAEPAGGSSPCRVASTPRASGYRSGGADVDGDRGVGVGGQSPESCPLPPPESPGSAYSTFSQAQAHIQRSSAAAGAEDDGHDRLLAGEGVDSPFFMHPPAPDTPGSMASTPNFDNLPRAGESTSVSMGHHLPDHFSLQHAKRPRTDY